MSIRHFSPQSQDQRPLDGLPACHHTDQTEVFKQFVGFSLTGIYQAALGRDRKWKKTPQSLICPLFKAKLALSTFQDFPGVFILCSPCSEELTRSWFPFSRSLCTNLNGQKNAASLFHASCLVKNLSLKQRGLRTIWMLQRQLTPRYLGTCKYSQYY